MSKEIKFCPFCGAKAELDTFPEKHCDTYGITCSNEKCIAHSIFETYCTPEEAATEWNHRAQQLNEPLTNFDYITASSENLIKIINLSRYCETCPASASCKITTGETTCRQAILAWLNQSYTRKPEEGEAE